MDTMGQAVGGGAIGLSYCHHFGGSQVLLMFHFNISLFGPFQHGLVLHSLHTCTGTCVFCFSFEFVV